MSRVIVISAHIVGIDPTGIFGAAVGISSGGAIIGSPPSFGSVIIRISSPSVVGYIVIVIIGVVRIIIISISIISGIVISVVGIVPAPTETYTPSRSIKSIVGISPIVSIITIISIIGSVPEAIIIPIAAIVINIHCKPFWIGSPFAITFVIIILNYNIPVGIHSFGSGIGINIGEDNILVIF